MALDWAFESDDVDIAVRLGASLWMWWARPDQAQQGLWWIKRVRAMPRVAEHARYHRVIAGHAFLAMLQGEMAQAIGLAEEARRLAERTHDSSLVALALSIQGTSHAYRGEVETARRVLRASIAYSRTTGLRWIEMLNLGSIGALALSGGDLAAAERDIYESVRIAGGLPLWCRATAYNVLGDLLRAKGEPDEAGRAYSEALVLFEAIDPYRKYVPHGMLHNLGYVALAKGDIQRAAALFVQSADMYRAVGTDRRGLSECIIGLACTAVRAECHALAARLFGSAEAELERLATVLAPGNRADYERGLARLGAAMSPDGMVRARDEGRMLALDDALDQARALQVATRREPPARPGRASSLTAREYEVAPAGRSRLQQSPDR